MLGAAPPANRQAQCVEVSSMGKFDSAEVIVSTASMASMLRGAAPGQAQKRDGKYHRGGKRAECHSDITQQNTAASQNTQQQSSHDSQHK
jgi:hypothetical protein